MTTANRFEDILANKSLAQEELELLGIRDSDRAYTNLLNIARLHVPIELLGILFELLREHLPNVSDPDMALNNLERFFVSVRSPLSAACLFERDPTSIPILLKIFSTSQYLTDLLIKDTESYDSLRLTEGQPIAREILVDALTAELQGIPADDDELAMARIRRFKHRETLRIAFGDIVGRQDLQTVTTQISYLADAICQAALEFCQRWLIEKYGGPIGSSGSTSNVVLVALGKLGGLELNYSSDIDLIILYDEDGVGGFIAGGGDVDCRNSYSETPLMVITDVPAP